jgi:hypothetical protein
MKTNYPSPAISRLLFAVMFTFITAGLIAQETNTCAEKLKTAQSFFDKGQVEQIPLLLKDCLKSGFKKEEELTAYKLLIQTFLLSDKLAAADSTMMEFLKKNPEYVLSPTDHSSFVYLYNNFVVKPVVQIGIHAGTNIPFLTFVTPNSVYGEKDVKTKYSRKIVNLFISVESKFKVTDKLEASIEAGFSQLKFSSKTTVGTDIVNYTESQQRIEIPVSLSYSFKSFGKFTPYARFGAGAAVYMGVTSTASNSYTDKSINLNLTGENLSRKDSRVSVDYFAQAAGGVKYKISKGYLFAELRTNWGIMEQQKHGGQTVSVLEYYYGFGDPEFRINAVNINIGYSHTFYKPTKRKE